MKKLIFTFTFTLGAIFFSSSLFAQLTAKVYEAPNCKQIVQKHKTMAILPMDVQMTDNRPSKKNRTPPEELDKQALLYQKGFQNSMYSWFLKRKTKGKMVDIDIQDVDKTNTILKRNGIETSEDLALLTKDEIAKMLEVDALFGGSATTNVTMGAGGAFAASLVFGSFASKTGEADVFIKLWDGESSDMIWSFDRTVASNYANSPERVIEYLMKRVSKRFPYEK